MAVLATGAGDELAMLMPAEAWRDCTERGDGTAEELLSVDFFLTGVPALLEASERSWDENLMANKNTH